MPEQQNVSPGAWHAESIRRGGAPSAGPPFLMLVMDEWPQVIQPSGDPGTGDPGKARLQVLPGGKVTAEMHPSRPAEGRQQ